MTNISPQQIKKLVVFAIRQVIDPVESYSPVAELSKDTKETLNQINIYIKSAAITV